LGDKARFYGDWETAISEYQFALQLAQDPEDLAFAELGIGLTLVEAGQYVEALQRLTAFLEQYPDSALLGHGFFLRARASLSLGDDEQAIRDFEQYLLHRPGILDSYVQEQMGDAYRRLGRPLEGVERYLLAIAAPRIEGTLGLQIKIAYALYEAGDYLQALEKFSEVYNLATEPETKAAMNLLAGRALMAIGDTETAYSKYLDSVYAFPQEYESYLGLIELVDAGVVVDEFQRGLVDYFAEAYTPALAAFNRFLSITPTGTGFYYRGLTRLELGDPWGAVQDFQIVIDSYPDAEVWKDAWFEKAYAEWDELSAPNSAVETFLGFVNTAPEHASAPEALYEAGRISEWHDELADAEAIWIRIPQEYPTSSQAFDGAFLSGVTRFRLGRYTEARDALLLADAITLEEGEKAAARLWVGKTYVEEGDPDSAEEAWVMAAVSDPTGYYSERASDLLQDREPFQPLENFTIPSNYDLEREEAENWLRSTFIIQGPEPLSELDPILASDPRMKRGHEFWQLGLYEEARAEFEALRMAYESSPEATYRLMHEFLNLGLYRSAIFAARNILNLAGMDDAGTMEAPNYFNYIRFGFYFDDLVFPEAERQNLNPIFVFSVLRQESLFEGFVTSYADARGLMQVIPSTGQGIYAQLGWPPGYTAEDLYRPVVSVRFGTTYLAEQRDRFDGDLFATLSAYNAGPTNTLIWKDLSPDDPDLFLEIIGLNQPQLYIRMIYEIYDIYCNLYGTP
jgi:soluble lytic murein transglycosylase